MPKEWDHSPSSHTRGVGFLRLCTSNDIEVFVTSWPLWSQAEVALEVLCVLEMCGPYHAGLIMLFMLQMLAFKPVLFILTV